MRFLFEVNDRFLYSSLEIRTLSSHLDVVISLSVFLIDFVNKAKYTIISIRKTNHIPYFKFGYQLFFLFSLPETHMPILYMRFAPYKKTNNVYFYISCTRMVKNLEV